MKKRIILISVLTACTILFVYVFLNLYIGCKKSDRKFTEGTWAIQNLETSELIIEDFEFILSEYNENADVNYIYSNHKKLTPSLIINGEKATLEGVGCDHRIMFFDFNWNGYRIGGTARLKKPKNVAYLSANINISKILSDESYEPIFSENVTLMPK